MTKSPDTPVAPPARRLAAFFATLGGIAVAVAFFLPVAHVPRAEAKVLAERIQAALDARAVKGAGDADFVRVFEDAAATGAVRPVDLIAYARTARDQREGRRAVVRPPDGGAPLAEADLRIDRLLLILIVLLGAVPLGGLMLAGYAVGWRLRRLAAPVLVLSLVVGVLALVLPLAIELLQPTAGPLLIPAIGYHLSVAGGVVLLLVALFGVTVRNWYVVYLLGAATLAAVAGVLYLAWSQGWPA
jgi:hypothetical protein